MIYRFLLISLCFNLLAEVSPEVYRGEKLWGYRLSDKIVIKEQFLEARAFTGKIASVRTESGWGIINDAGKILIKSTLENEPQNSGSFTYFKLEGLYGMLNNVHGYLVFPPIYQSIRKFEPKLFMIKKDDLWFATDEQGKFLLNNGASKAYSLTESLVAFKTEHGWGLLNHYGELVVQPFAERIDVPKFGLMRYCKDDQYGFLNEQGDVIVDAQYSDATDFTKSGFAFVKSADSWLKIDRKGNVINLAISTKNEQPAEIVARLFKEDESERKIEIYQRNQLEYRYNPYGYFPYRRYYHRPVPYRPGRTPYYNNYGYDFGTKIFYKDGKIYGGGPSYFKGLWK